jgi:phosphoadenosine phosphosulfate reductase
MTTLYTAYKEMTADELKAISDRFEGASPESVLEWASDEFGSAIALATGFGAEGCVLMEMLSRVRPQARIFYLDTDLLFPETYALKERLESQLGIRFERISTEISLEEQSKLYGEKLWERQPDECCRIRKVEPLKKMLSGLDAWITAIRRDQSPARANAGIVEQDKKFGIVKVNPLATWSSKQVWDYIVKNNVPYNPLHDQGYPSIGCRPCTSVVQIGEDPRAGRWRGKGKTECGLHQ